MPKTPWADRYRAAPTNKSNVMRTIILEGPISRAALAKRVGLSLPSVMTITENLINRGLVRAVGKGKSSGGKPPELLSVVPESEYYMGVDIGRGTIRLVLMNLAQKVVYGTMVETGEVQPVEAFVDRLCERIQSSLLESGVADRALAVAESGWRGDGGESGTHTVLCVNIGHGIGAALMQNNQLYYGSSGTSGELGHITVCKDGPLCACGNSGCLEAVCSGLPTSLRERCGGASERIDAKLVFEAAAKGDAVALSIVDKATDYIGIGLAMAINILDPDCIVLCGGLTKNGPLFFDRVAHSMQMRQMRQAGRHVTLRLGTRGDYGTAIGAAHIISYNGWRVPRLEHYY